MHVLPERAAYRHMSRAHVGSILNLCTLSKQNSQFHSLFINFLSTYFNLYELCMNYYVFNSASLRRKAAFSEALADHMSACWWLLM